MSAFANGSVVNRRAAGAAPAAHDPCDPSRVAVALGVGLPGLVMAGTAFGG